MTPANFIALHKRLGISRAALARALEIAPNTATAYAHGRRPIPRHIALACAAIAYGLPPMD